MELKSVKIMPWGPAFHDVKKLLKSQIPEDELESFFVLRFATIRKRCDCTCFYENGQLAGFYYVLLAEKAAFLLYLVVNPAVQSKGYGSAICGEMKKRYPDYQIDMHIEIPKDRDSKDEQAAKRYRFYERNGFLYTGMMTEDDGVRYWILSNKGSAFDTEKHKKFLEKGSKISAER